MTRRLFLALVVGLVVAPSLLAQATRDEVMKVDDAFMQARLSGDSAAYANLLADEFTWTTRGGNTTNKTQHVESLQASGMNPEIGKEVRVYGDAAVITGSARLTADGMPVSVRFVRVWAKRDGRWQAVLHQGTTVGQ